MPAIATLTLLLAAAPGLFAQWPAYPTSGVPRTTDGKANLAAPAPKTPDGKPDLTGIWQYARPPGTPAPAPPPATPTAARAGSEIIPAAVRTSQFWNLGASFKDGLPFQP